MQKLAIIALFLLSSLGLFSQNITTPETYFGFKPGSDHMLMTYEQLTDYLKLLDSQSDRLQMFQIGSSPMGKPMYVACFSSPGSIKNIESLKEINRKLALDATLDDKETETLVKDGRVFVLATMSMHSTEVAPSQSVPLIAYDWVTTTDEATLKALDDVVFMIVPCHNPDGMDMVVDDYNKTKGTKYEGSSMPGIYHKYVGHDNNRDFIILSQSDTKAISAIESTDWFPQVMVEKHQMGSNGARYFVPPNCDPIAENVDAALFIWTGIFGQEMIRNMTAAGLKGITQHSIFDNYWPGSTETSIWKNVIAMLTEAAGCQLAKPIYIEPTELTGGEKGLAEYKKSIDLPEPWPGGWWRLGDIVQYEIVSTNTILKTASDNKEKILQLRNDLCKKEVKLGQTQAPYYFMLPANQHDQSELVALVKLLQEQGVNVFKLRNDISLGQIRWKTGDIVVPLAQPYRAFVKEVMEAQKYPERHFTEGGVLMEPYDITTWSLPLHKGLSSVEVDERSADVEKALEPLTRDYTLAIPFTDAPFTILTSADNESYHLAFDAMHKNIPVKRSQEDFVFNGVKVPAGSFLLEKGQGTADILKKADFPLIFSDHIPTGNWVRVTLPRIGLVETYFRDMDAGWTRFIFDTYGIGFTVIRPGEFEAGNLSRKFDLIIFPDQDANVTKDGKYKGADQYFMTNYRPEFTKGIGPKGFDSLVSFFSNGGNIISWGESVNLFDTNLSLISGKSKEDFRLPFRNAGETMKNINCPGSLLRMNLVQTTPLTWGMGNETGIFYRGKPLFTTSIPQFDADRRVIGYFGEDKLLMSGFLEGEKFLTNKPVMLWLKKGKGQMVLMGFSPIFRASVPADYKLLFNAILLPDLKE